MPNRKKAGFSIVEVSLATLIVLSLIALANVPHIADFITTRATPSALAAHLKEAQQWAVRTDVDRRIRLATEAGYIVDKPANIGSLLETSYRLPEGF